MKVILIVIAALLYLVACVALGTYLACSGVWKSRNFPIDENDVPFCTILVFAFPITILVAGLMWTMITTENAVKGLIAKKKELKK